MGKFVFREDSAYYESDNEIRYNIYQATTLFYERKTDIGIIMIDDYSEEVDDVLVDYIWGISDIENEDKIIQGQIIDLIEKYENTHQFIIKRIGKPATFIDDEEKMFDFFLLSKEEFLESYSYILEREYDATLKEVAKIITDTWKRRNN